MIKVIALDIDGTLYNSQEEIMPLTRVMLMKAHKMGIILILASGRSIHGLKCLARKVNFPLDQSILIGFNGASVVDATSHEVYYNETLPSDLYKAIIESTRTHSVMVMVPFNDQLWVEQLDHERIKYESETEFLELKGVEDLSSLKINPNKIMIAAEASQIHAYLQNTPKMLLDQACFTRSGGIFIDVTANGCDKGTALKRFCELKGIQRNEVIAFGDNYNDLEMIEYAGVGIAMGNAVDDLKKVADEVTLSNNEDGIGVWLSKYLGDYKSS